MKSGASAKDQLRITVSEEKGVRYLHFGTEWVQGAMRVRKPWALELDYSRHMMAWLLFQSAPERLLQIGLGAGSLTKFVYREMPQIALTVVENSPAVYGVARSQFQLPAENDRFEVVIEDGEHYIAQPSLKQYFSIVQIDVFDAQARGPALDSLAFYQTCLKVLKPGGIVVVNLFGDVPSYARNYERILQAFGGYVLVLPPLEAGNVIMLGFRAPELQANGFMTSWTALRKRADEIEEQFNLNAHGWINGLKTSAERSLGGPLIGDD